MYIQVSVDMPRHIRIHGTALNTVFRAGGLEDMFGG